MTRKSVLWAVVLVLLVSYLAILFESKYLVGLGILGISLLCFSMAYAIGVRHNYSLLGIDFGPSWRRFSALFLLVIAFLVMLLGIYLTFFYQGPMTF
ncbi:hypothetical protein OZX68_00305 [Streptococcaceae bacterium ESL0729]|nr:hypothetical protein OZX68_00305 [Streptococcaceae bacterium ESL0729]